MRKFLILILTGIFIMTAFGCVTSISTIKSEPNLYVGSKVFVSGQISLVVPIPFMDFTIYQIDDSSGKMFILSKKRFSLGSRMTASAKVIGFTDENTKSAAASIARDISEFLTEHNFADPAEADRTGKKLFRLIATLGGSIEGSYFLMSAD